MILENFPLFPLGTVLFPGGMLPLRIFEARYMDMSRQCLREKSTFGVCLIREGREVGTPATHEMLGCEARIIDCDMQQMGVLNISTQGARRFRVLSTTTNAQGLILGRVEFLEPAVATTVPAQFAACTSIIKRAIREHGPQIFPQPHQIDDADWVSYRLAEVLPFPPAEKQKLLELDDSLARLSIMNRILSNGGLAAE